MKVAFLLNPIAGLGGTVALKGTDGLAKEALRLGAKPITPVRAETFFHSLDKQISNDIRKQLVFLVPKSPMGEQILSKFSFKYEVIPVPIQNKDTSAEDTKIAVRHFEEQQVDLIIFVGGDGTSIDVGTSITNQTPILGIPSGVKTYGAVFSHSLEEAVTILLAFFNSKSTQEAELLDLDEEQYKKGVISISLRGIARVPAFPEFLQHAKERIEITESEENTLERIADEIFDVLRRVKTSPLLIIGPGSTFSPLGKKMNISRSILGVDCVTFDYQGNYSILIKDAREDQIFNILTNYTEVFILITPIGGMGYILGRGNHQISPRIIKKVPKDHLLIACTKRKLKTIIDQTLRVDTSDEELNSQMIGYIRVITDFNERQMVRVIH